MKIAILGWGSLIWDSRDLCIDGEWHDDGPELPIEFARISGHDRLTLVLRKGEKNVRTLWVHSGLNDLEYAICNLKKREGTKRDSIGYIDLNSGYCCCNVIPKVVDSIKDWAREKNLDAVIWTDLPSNFEDRRGLFTDVNVIAYLRCLKDQCNAEEYIRKAPCQIRTRMRQVIERELGWTPVRACN